MASNRTSPSLRSWGRPGPSPLRSRPTSHDAPPPLHIRHLLDLASWASSAIPPLGAFLGSRLAFSCEASGCPLPCSNCFSCERCESILEVGANCSVRVKPWKGPRSSRSVNKIVYFCHYCSYENRKSGTRNAYIKGKLIEATGCNPCISTPETVRSTEKVACCDRQTSTAEVVSSGRVAKKRKRKGWLTLKELTATSNQFDEANKASPSAKEFVQSPGVSLKHSRSPMAAGPLASFLQPFSVTDDPSDVAAEKLRQDTMPAGQSVSSEEAVDLPVTNENDAGNNVSEQFRIVETQGSPGVSECYGAEIDNNDDQHADRGERCIDRDDHLRTDATDGCELGGVHQTKMKNLNSHGSAVCIDENEHCRTEVTDGHEFDGVHQTEKENLDSPTLDSKLVFVPVAADTSTAKIPNDDNCLTNTQSEIGFSSDREEDTCNLRFQGITCEENLKAAAALPNSDSSEFCDMDVREDENQRETCVSGSKSTESMIDSTEGVEDTDTLVNDDVAATVDHLKIRKQHLLKSEVEDSLKMEGIDEFPHAATNTEHMSDRFTLDRNEVEHVEISKPPEMENVICDDTFQKHSNLHAVSCPEVSEFHNEDHAIASQGLCETSNRKETEDTDALEKTGTEKDDTVSLMASKVSTPVLQDKALQSLEQVLHSVTETLDVEKRHSELLIDLQKSVRGLNIGRRLQKLISSEDILEQKLSALDARYGSIERKLSEIPNIRNEIHCLSTRVTEISYMVTQLRDVIAESLVSKLDQTLQYTKDALQIREERVEHSQREACILKLNQQLESSKITDQMRGESADGSRGERAAYQSTGESADMMATSPTHGKTFTKNSSRPDKVEGIRGIEDGHLLRSRNRKRGNDGEAVAECRRPSKQERHHLFVDVTKSDQACGATAGTAREDESGRVSDQVPDVKNRKRRPIFSRVGRHWFQIHPNGNGKWSWRMMI